MGKLINFHHQAQIDTNNGAPCEVIDLIPKYVRVRLIRIGKATRARDNNKWELFTVDEHNEVKTMGLGEFDKSTALELAQRIQDFVDNKGDSIDIVQLFAMEIACEYEED